MFDIRTQLTKNIAHEQTLHALNLEREPRKTTTF